jgi:hypothetical protein
VAGTGEGLERLVRWNLAAVSLGAAGIHFAVIVPHLDEYTPFGIFFLIVAWFQTTWAVLVVATNDRRVLTAGLVVNALVMAIWVWSRTAGLPIGPEPGVAEEIGPADTISTALEAVLVVWTTLLLARVYRWREPSRRFVFGSALFVWAVVVLLTAVAVMAEVESVPAGH